MKFSKKLGEKTETWGFEPFIFAWNLLTIITLSLVLNIIGISLYIYFDKKFRGKYLKEFILKSLFVGVICFVLVLVIFFPTMFVLGFDDAGYFGEEKITFIYGIVLILIIFILIFYSYTSAKIYRKQKNLCYKGEE